jgi:hypothetical protein
MSGGRSPDRYKIDRASGSVIAKHSDHQSSCLPSLGVQVGAAFVQQWSVGKAIVAMKRRGVYRSPAKIPSGSAWSTGWPRAGGPTGFWGRRRREHKRDARQHASTAMHRAKRYGFPAPTQGCHRKTPVSRPASSIQEGILAGTRNASTIMASWLPFSATPRQPEGRLLATAQSPLCCWVPYQRNRRS